MTKLIAALILSLSATVAVADVTLTDDAKTITITVHSAELAYGINSNNSVQVDAWMTMVKDGKAERERFAVTGCDKDGGRIASLDTTTYEVVGKQTKWIRGGPSMLDETAENVCEMAFQKATAESKPTKPAKLSKSSI